MPRRHRGWIYALIGALWASGCIALCLDQFGQRRGAFGSVPNPAKPLFLQIHSIAAIASMYLFGWISARHILRWWMAGQRRWSGATLAASFAVLIGSGFALFFLSSDDWQRGTVLVHDIVGIGVTVVALQHWWFAPSHRHKAAVKR